MGMGRGSMAAMALVALLAISESLAAQTTKAPAPDWDMVAFEMRSWGEPVTSWRIMADGQGSWTETVRENPNAPLGDHSLVWHELNADKDGVAKLFGILAALPQPAPSYRDCTDAISDQPYGNIRLTKGATTTEIAYNAGCLDDDYVAFLDVLRNANGLVEGWGKVGKVLRTEKP